MLNLKYTSDLAKGADSFAFHEKRPRDDSNPWNVAWPSDSHRRLEILGDSKVVINWMNGDWEVKGNEHNSHVRDVIDQFVRWYLGGIFRPRNDEGCWCRHVFQESNKAADTHANWLMDNGDSNPGAQWKRRDYSEKLKSAKHVVLSLDGARRGSGNGAAAWILWIRNMNGEFERISRGGKVLKDLAAMTAEREALRMGVEHLMTLFPAEAKDFQFVVENESRETKYKVDTQSMRLFGLRNDHAEDVHRADANRLEKKNCDVGNTASEWRLVLVQDSDFAGDLADSKSTSGGMLCVQEADGCVTQQNRSRDNLIARRSKFGRNSCTEFVGLGD